MALHHRTHPEPVEGCFGCKAAGIDFALPAHFKAIRRGSHDGISEYSAYKQEMHTILRNDREGRFEKAR